MMSDADPRDYRSLGDLLRDAREEKQVSFEQLNESTKISVRVLKALEQDDLEAASGVIYVRGFVRTLAGFYDLDPEWLGAKLDALADETSRPVLPVEDDDGRNAFSATLGPGSSPRLAVSVRAVDAFSALPPSVPLSRPINPTRAMTRTSTATNP
jgi:hypothetical protein